MIPKRNGVEHWRATLPFAGDCCQSLCVGEPMSLPEVTWDVSVFTQTLGLKESLHTPYFTAY